MKFFQKYFFLVLLLAAPLHSTYALSFTSFFENVFLAPFAKLSEVLNMSDDLNKVATRTESFYKSKVSLESFKTIDTKQIKNKATNPVSPPNIEHYDLDTLLASKDRQNLLEKKIKSLVLDTNLDLSVEKTCKNEDKTKELECKNDLFIGCGNSLFLGFEMAPECGQFEMFDYEKYLEFKKSTKQTVGQGGEYVDFSFGKVFVTQGEEYTLPKKEDEYIVNSHEINFDISIYSEEELQSERIMLESGSEVGIEREVSNNKVLGNILEKVVEKGFSGWVTGWATVFAVNGGKKEAGFKMNRLTAMGYNPYNSKVCIVSLPYKTIDKFYNTNLNKCVKQKNLKCILDVKSKIKNETIEVLMVKNGKKVTFPLGDFGPAEWTGNAIDLNGCAQKKLGATGKDLVMFRPSN
jgi:hypothetical protein